MLKSLSIYPPLAFARVGSSDTPCCTYSWSRNEISHDRPATTSLRAEETLTLAGDGTVTASLPNEIILKDENGRYRPVCPYFELWGVWEKDGSEVEGPITPEVLGDLGLTLDDVGWTVEIGNLKPYHVTLKEGDKVSARLRIPGSDTTKKLLKGVSPNGAEPLVLPAQHIPMGAVQLSKPDDVFPELRLRFYAPAGTIYGPPNIHQRITDLIADRPELKEANSDWLELDLPGERARVNPNSGWAMHNFSSTPVPPFGSGDPRLNPTGLVASLVVDVADTGVRVKESLGLVDDVGDGVISCEISGLVAHARVAVGPPDFAPANRPVVSLQDGLSDRQKRAEIRDLDISDQELEDLVADIFERALETSELMNKDAQNHRARRVNQWESDADLPNPLPGFESDPLATLWPTFDDQVTDEPSPSIDAMSVDAMPITSLGQRKHRRYNAIEYLRDRLREEPELIEKWVRPPRGPNTFYDRRMPALMRGSDRNPMHLTRRQYELIQLWAKRQSD